MSIIEIIAVTFSLLCVVLTTRQNIWCWPAGIVGVAAFFILFLEEKLYSEMGLQVIFFLQSIYGWYNWSKTRNGKKLQVKKARNLFFAFDLFVTLLLSVGFAFVLKNFTDDSQPFLDSSTAFISVLANWYLTRKILQAWILWIAVDILLMIMFVHQGLYLSAALYLIMLYLSTTGLIRWRKDLKTV